MRHEEFETLCRSIGSGGEERVRHIVLHQMGRIIACLPDDMVEVELDNGERRTWSKDNIAVLH